MAIRLERSGGLIFIHGAPEDTETPKGKSKNRRRLGLLLALVFGAANAYLGMKAGQTIAATIPVAMFIGLYMRNIRPGRVLEGSLLGVILLLLSVAFGGWIDHQPMLRTWFDHPGLPLAWAVIGYGFAAAILPVWLLLAPRDYLSTYMKLGTVILLALAIVWMQPTVKMPALTQFIDGSGPIFGDTPAEEKAAREQFARPLMALIGGQAEPAGGQHPQRTTRRGHHRQREIPPCAPSPRVEGGAR